MPQDFEEAYEEILTKVKEGTIEAERLDDSVLRILAVKIQRGLLDSEQLKSTPVPTSTPTPTPSPAPKHHKHKHSKHSKKQ